MIFVASLRILRSSALRLSLWGGDLPLAVVPPREDSSWKVARHAGDSSRRPSRGILHPATLAAPTPLCRLVRVRISGGHFPAGRAGPRPVGSACLADPLPRLAGT